MSAIESKPVGATFMGAAVIGALWAATALTRHASLGTSAFDLGIFTNAMWNLTHGNGYVSSVKGGINLFVDILYAYVDPRIRLA